MNIKLTAIVLILVIVVAGSIVLISYGGFFTDDTIKYDLEKKYQILDGGFGASGCWWAPNIGGWEVTTDDGKDVREEIARLLYDDESGLGLDIYRYNIGARVLQDDGYYSDEWRSVEGFLREDGSLDFTRDKNGRYMMKLALKYGASQVILFANSAPNTMTKNGKAHSDNGKCNIDSSNYIIYSKYFCDVAEYFVNNGVPVVSLSPVNEPEWDWTGGQEGCHFEPDELVSFYEVFITEKETRPLLDGIGVSIFESGEMKGRVYEYLECLSASNIIRPYLDKIDVHSYWTTRRDKRKFSQYMEKEYPETTISITEWCQMEHGRRNDLSTAFTIANVIIDDLTCLNATSWQHWLGVSCGDYEDGLLYLDKEIKNEINIPVRYCAFSQFTKHVKRGAVRVESNIFASWRSSKSVKNCSFINPNGELVTVILNDGKELKLNVDGLEGRYTQYNKYVLNENNLHNTKKSLESRVDKLVIPAKSLVTVVYTK